MSRESTVSIQIFMKAPWRQVEQHIAAEAVILLIKPFKEKLIDYIE